MDFTREQIEQMPAGRELDNLVSLHVIGAQSCPANSGEDFIERREDRPWEPMPYYSLRIADAWPIMEKLLDEWPDCGLHRATPETSKLTRVYWGFDGHGWTWADAETAPLAICRAALLALLPDA